MSNTEVTMSDSERIHVLDVVGSPWCGGNTENLVDEVLRGAEAAGATVKSSSSASLTSGRA